MRVQGRGHPKLIFIFPYSHYNYLLTELADKKFFTGSYWVLLGVAITSKNWILDGILDGPTIFAGVGGGVNSSVANEVELKITIIWWKVDLAQDSF